MVVQVPGAIDIRQVRNETVVRSIHTVYDFQMRGMSSDGPIGGTYDDFIRIIAGIGYNSTGYDAPYDMSMCGKFKPSFTYKLYKYKNINHLHRSASCNDGKFYPNVFCRESRSDCKCQSSIVQARS